MEDSLLNAIERLKTDYARKLRSTDKVDLTECLLDSWLKNNHITADKIYYLSQSVCIFYTTPRYLKEVSQDMYFPRRSRFKMQPRSCNDNDNDSDNDNDNHNHNNNNNNNNNGSIQHFHKVALHLLSLYL